MAAECLRPLGVGRALLVSFPIVRLAHGLPSLGVIVFTTALGFSRILIIHVSGHVGSDVILGKLHEEIICAVPSCGHF